MATQWRFVSKGSPSSKIKSVGGMGGSQSALAVVWDMASLVRLAYHYINPLAVDD